MLFRVKNFTFVDCLKKDILSGLGNKRQPDTRMWAKQIWMDTYLRASNKGLKSVNMGEPLGRQSFFDQYSRYGYRGAYFAYI